MAAIVPGLFADRLEAKGGVFLRGVKATGEVRLLGAKLGGDLDCTGATFRAEKDAKGNPRDALAADGLEAKGGVFLRDIEATGAVRLLGAKLGGNLECDRRDVPGGEGREGQVRGRAVRRRAGGEGRRVPARRLRGDGRGAAARGEAGREPRLRRRDVPGGEGRGGQSGARADPPTG